MTAPFEAGRRWAAEIVPTSEPFPTGGLCPGGCGKLHRTCCDSVIGEAHQSRCAFDVREAWDRELDELRRTS